MDAESLDIERRDACERYLIAAGHARPGELDDHRPLTGGVSSRTVLVSFNDGRRWVLKQALAKLRVAADWFSDPSRVHREALGMRVLGELAPPGSIPKLIFDDETHHVLGMEAVPEPHENWKTMLMDGCVHPSLFQQFGEILAALHCGSYTLRSDCGPQFKDRSFFESLRIEPYYKYSAGKEARANAFLHTLIEETRRNCFALVHGDYSPKNVLIRNKRVILLDHEVIHWGDPAFDVGFALTHLLVKVRFNGFIYDNLDDGFLCGYRFYDDAEDVPWMFEDEYWHRCIRHTLGCLVARAIGRSPLEYLNEESRRVQLEAAIRLIDKVPKSMPELFERFTRDVGTAQ